MTEQEHANLREMVDGRIRQFGGQFENYLVIIKDANTKEMFWKSNDKTWAMGAAKRFLICSEEAERIEERQLHKGNE